jgi:hypothetical protein
MPGQHLAGDLCIARLVRASEAECAQPKKEKEIADGRDKRDLGGQQFGAKVGHR